MRDPRYNKGLAFTDKERDAHYITGLLPPVVLSQDVQVINLRFFTIMVSVKSSFFEVMLIYRRRKWCTIFVSIRFLCSVTWLSWIFRWFIVLFWFSFWSVCKWELMNSESFRKGMRDYFISFWLIMWRSCFRLCIPLRWVRLVKSMGAFIGGHKVFTSAWKRSSCDLILVCYIIFHSFFCFFKYNVAFLKGKDSWSIEELATERDSSYCCHRWWAHSRSWRSWLPGKQSFKYF